MKINLFNPYVWRTILVILALLFMGMLIALSCTSCDVYKNYKADNLGEEIIEEILELQTGVNIDLSPGTPE